MIGYNSRMLKKALQWGACAALAVGAVYVVTNAAMISAEQKYTYSRAEDVPPHAVAIVLGAAIYQSGELSPVFLGRANAAIELYKAGKAANILVSGDNSTVEHNELDPAKRYLIGQGIPEGDIYLDHAGFDTYSTMYRAREIFGVTSAVITTQGYHLSRALFLAHMQGIDAVGYRADAGNRFTLQNEGRESLARIKAVWDVVVHRPPKFLGEKILIK